ncbi:MAG: protein kinase [Acidobacteriota bacterium]
MLGRIRIEALIGLGGMGEVYRGVDEALRRPVAVKTIRAEQRFGPEAKGRFLREARILSRLDHPGICRVYELIERPEADYLVLELVEGRTLRVAAQGGLARREILQIALGVTEALAGAHRQGIVHRDLKPENIMLMPGGGIKVLDFGIARSIGAPGRPGGDDSAVAEPGAELSVGIGDTAAWRGAGEASAADETGATFATRGGSVLGTARYMSPEQAGGGLVSVASDMYFLGVMLQELLTGKPAYGEAPPEELYLKVLRAETVPVTGLNATLTRLLRELESLDPRKRPTSDETARRLQFLLDTPRRRRRQVLIGALVTAIAVATGGAIVSRVQGRRQAEIARRFATAAAEIEWRLRAEHLSPPHDIRPARQRVRASMQSIQAQMAELGSAAEGPGLLALGRAALSLGEDEAARRHLEAAWAAGLPGPDVAYSLGLAYGQLYTKALAKIDPAAPSAQRTAELQRLRQELRDPAAEYLRAGAGAAGLYPAYVNALIALNEERFDDALDHARTLGSAEPWFYEAELIEAAVHHRQALDAGTIRQDLTFADQAFAATAEALTRASQKARSDPRVWLSLCDCEARQLTILSLSRLRPIIPDLYRRALATCEQAVALDPASGAPHSRTALLCVAAAGAELRLGNDPEPWYEKAMESASRGVLADKEDGAARYYRGWVANNVALRRIQQGRSPLQVLEQAVADFRDAIERAADVRGARSGLGDACALAAWWETSAGGDPSRWLNQGIPVLEEFVRMQPENLHAHASLGHLYLMKSGWDGEQGGDGLAAAYRAVEAYRAAAVGATSPNEPYNVGLGLVAAGVQLLASGQDPREVAREALGAADRSQAASKELGSHHFLRGLALSQLALYAYLTGESPAATVAALQHEYAAGFALMPDNFEGYWEQAAALLIQARWEIRHGISPEAVLAKARTSLARGLALNPSLARSHRTRGELEIQAGRWRLARGASPEAQLAEAERALTRALQHNGRDANSFRALAEVHLWRARWLAKGAGVAATEIEKQLAACSRALEINPRLAEAEMIRAGLLDLRGHSSAPGAAGQDLDQAAATARRVLELNPLLGHELELYVPRTESSRS